MSKVKIEGNASGTGTLTIAAPNTNTDRTIDIPDGDGELLLANGDGSQLTNLPAGYTDADALSLFNASGSAPVYAPRAWIQFSCWSSNTIRDSGNVSSLTDNGTGKINVNFSTALPDANFVIAGTGAATGNSTNPIIVSYGPSNTNPVNKTTSTVKLCLQDVGNGSFRDSDYVDLSVLR